jgi:hypothetical protein
MYSFKKLLTSTKYSLISSVFSFILAGGTICSIFPDWNRIGLAGVDITAITAGIDAYHNKQPIILIGTENGDVYTVSGAHDSIAKYPTMGSGISDNPRGAVRALLVGKTGIETFAATDSGLYGESMIFSSLPAWKKLDSIHFSKVTALALMDSIYCAATPTALFRTKTPFGTWTPCSISNVLPSQTPDPHFTSLTSWWNTGFVAGSSWAEGTTYFGGVLTGGRQPQYNWINSTCIFSYCVDNNVYSLTTDNSGRLYAGTSKGIFCLNEIDTGKWYPITPQLTGTVVRHVCVNYDSSIHSNQIFASTDSGIYILSPRLNPNKWVCTTRLKSYGIASPTPNNSKVFYAATETGLWKWDFNSTQVKKTIPTRTSSKLITSMYTINGRKIIPNNSFRNHPGVYISVQYDENKIIGSLSVAHVKN